MSGLSIADDYSEDSIRGKGSIIMIIRLAVILVSGLLFSGCATSAETRTDPEVGVDPHNCEEGDRHGPEVKQVNINYMTPDIVVQPMRICVQPGDVLKFKLNGNPHIEVRVEGKGIVDEWINGDNSGKNQAFFVLVPDDLLPEQVEDPMRSYYYSVIIDGVDHDPEVRVKRNYL
mgnify:FL=1